MENPTKLLICKYLLWHQFHLVKEGLPQEKTKKKREGPTDRLLKLSRFIYYFTICRLWISPPLFRLYFVYPPTRSSNPVSANSAPISLCFLCYSPPISYQASISLPARSKLPCCNVFARSPASWLWEQWTDNGWGGSIAVASRMAQAMPRNHNLVNDF